jgi:NADP-dependent 3-hydroxy acid dehydrogenase YdfG
LVHVSSISGHATGIGTPLYFASKHGCKLKLLSQVLRQLNGMHTDAADLCSTWLREIIG